MADRVAAALPVCCGRESCGAARAVCRVQALPAASARRAASSRALHWSTSLFWSRRRLIGPRYACAVLTASVAMLCIVHVRALRRSQGTKRHERREARGAGAVPRSESATLHMRGTRAERPRTSQKRAPRVQRDREARRRPNHVSVRAVQAGRVGGACLMVRSTMIASASTGSASLCTVRRWCICSIIDRSLICRSCT